jgi:hypothetical protein
MYLACLVNGMSYTGTLIMGGGGEVNYVLARHNRMCELANWSRLSNITSCSHVLVRATEEQAKQLNIHMRGESSS